jgi:hypothetical protein
MLIARWDMMHRQIFWKGSCTGARHRLVKGDALTIDIPYYV